MSTARVPLINKANTDRSSCGSRTMENQMQNESLQGLWIHRAF